GHVPVQIPGSVSTIDLRSQRPNGPFGHVTVRLDAGRYPTGAAEVAVTSEVAKDFGLHLGRLWHEGGRTLRVVGIVENPLDLLDQFALVAPGQLNPPTSISILLNGTAQTVQSLRLPSGTGITSGLRSTSPAILAEALVLVLSSLGLLFVGLLAVA